MEKSCFDCVHFSICMGKTHAKEVEKIEGKKRLGLYYQKPTWDIGDCCEHFAKKCSGDCFPFGNTLWGGELRDNLSHGARYYMK